MKKEREKLALIDGNSLLNRAYFATPLFSTIEGVPTNAVYGFIKLLLKIIEDRDPDYLIVVFDQKPPTFRNEMYEGYKSTRSHMPDELAMQLDITKNLLSAMTINVCEKGGVEADDVMGTISKMLDVDSYIYTGDRDCYQLVDDKTTVCFTKRGVSDLLEVTPSNFKEATDLDKPSQIIDYKALAGDKSDNIPGVAGIGEKTAKDLLERYGSLDGVYEHLDEIKGGAKKKLEENKDSAYLSYRLSRILRDCDIDVNLSKCVCPKKFPAAAKDMLASLEFKSVMAMDIFDEGVQIENICPKNVLCKSRDEIKDELEGGEIFADLGEERLSVYGGGEIKTFRLLSSFLDDGAVDFETFKGVLSAVFCGSANVVCYDFKSARHILDRYGIVPTCEFEDVALMRYLCEQTLFSNEWAKVCESEGFETENGVYCLCKLKGRYSKILDEEEDLKKLYRAIEKPLVAILYDMEKKGVKVSMEILGDIKSRFEALLNEYRDKIVQAAGVDFNINSHKQLGEILYAKFGIKEVKKKNSDKYSTSADVLEAHKEDCPIVADVLRYRFYQKLLSTYLDGLLPYIEGPENTVHTTYNQTATSTGRLSSSDPNLQNIPVREEDGKEIRKIFIPRDGNVFVDADYGQIELRLLAHMSGCKPLCEAFKAGEDIHAVTASQIFGVPVGEVTPAMRREAKTVNFGVIYGISEYGLAKNLGISTAAAREYIDRYFETYREVKAFMDESVAHAKKFGFVATITGRKRTIPEINSSHYSVRSFGERAAMNMPLQGSCADIMKMAMINVSRRLREERIDGELILQVHDELVLEVDQNVCQKAADILKYEMEHVTKLDVPLKAEARIGNNWYDMK